MENLLLPNRRKMSTENMNGPIPFVQVILLLLIGSLLPGALGKDVLNIGSLYDLKYGHADTAFHYAIDQVNRDTNRLPQYQLKAQVERIPDTDSFMVSQRVCSLLENGVVAIFGPESSLTSTHVQSMSYSFEIPHIEYRENYDEDPSESSFSISLYPHSSTLSMAYSAVLKNLKWKRFYFVYDNSEALLHIQNLLEDGNFDVLFKQLPQNPVEYRRMFMEIRGGGSTNMIVDVQLDKIPGVLQGGKQSGVLDAPYHFFFTSLDLESVDLSQYHGNGAKMTALRLMNMESPSFRQFMAGSRLQKNQITTEVAIVYDAIQLLVKAIEDMDRSTKLKTTSLTCNEDNHWDQGNSLLNHMLINVQQQSSLTGLTGKIELDSNGHRRNVDLDIVQLTSDGLKSIGTWSSYSGIGITSPIPVNNQTDTGHLRVSALLNEPYVMLREDDEGLSGNDRYEGFSIDLLQEIARIAGFEYTIEIPETNKYGTFNRKTNKWSGLIGQVANKKFDMAIGDITITSDRQKVVDFTHPFMNTGVSILFTRPERGDPNLFSFLWPLSGAVWIYVLLAYFGVSVLIFLLARLSPYEDVYDICGIRKIQDEEGVSCTGNQLTFCNSLWFAFGSVLGVGTHPQPKAISTRIVAGVWWFFIIIMMSFYIASLVTIMLSSTDVVASEIESVDDLARQSKIKYGAIPDGTTYDFFKTSKIAVYQRLFRTMEKKSSAVLPRSYVAGIRRVEEDAGNFAFFMESSSIEYIVERRCNLMQVGGLLDSKAFGMAFPKRSPYKSIINSALLKLKEDGIIQQIRKKWWEQRRGGGKCKRDDDVSSGRFTAHIIYDTTVAGLFIVLLVGMGIATIVAVLELLWVKKMRSRR